MTDSPPSNGSRRRLVVALFCLVLLLPPRAPAAESLPRVYLVVVDGLRAEALSAELMPNTWDLVHGGKERATFYPRARAVMPTVTNANHVSIITGCYPAAHGIVGNYYWERGPKLQRNYLDDGALIQVETLFTVIGREQPKLSTAGVFGKWKLADLFRGSAKQRSPTDLWGDLRGDRELPDPRSGLASDERTIDEVERTIARDDPRLLFVNLGDVDRTSHIYGPQSNEARKAVLEADRQLARLIKFLKGESLWQNVVLFVTADHGFTSVEPDDDRPYPLVLFGRELIVSGLKDFFAVSNGGVESVYVRDFDPRARELRPDQSERLKAARMLALKQPGIEEALYRLPNPVDGGSAHTLDALHPDWRLAHPRAGELLLVAKAGYRFDDPFSAAAAGLRGSHGGAGEIRIPILVTGGYAKLRRQIVESEPQAENPDLGLTAAWLLGIRPPRQLNGEPVPAKLSGRILTEAFEP
jgi:Type I phosphodiesterase / nucleotide pyrophosphatase